MKLLNTLFVFLLISFFYPEVVEAQSGKPIYEVLNLEQGCPLPELSKSSQAPIIERQEAVMEVPPPPPPPFPSQGETPSPPPSTESLIQELQDYLKNKEFSKQVKEFGENRFVQNEDYTWTLVSTNGKRLIETKFEIVIVASNKQNFTGKEVNKPGFNVYDQLGKAIFKENFQNIYPHIRDKYVFFNSGKYRGVATLDGKILIPAKYDQISQHQKAWVVQLGELKGVLNEKGKVLIRPKYKSLNIAYSNDKHIYSFVRDNNGELTILKNSKVFQKLGIKYYQYANEKIFDGRYVYYNHQLIDLKKKQFLFCGDKIKIETHQNVKNLFSITDKNREHWFFYEKGETIINVPVNSKASRLSFTNNLAVVGLKTDKKNPMGYKVYKTGLLNDELKWEIEPRYNSMSSIKETNLFIVKNQEHKYGVIDTEEKIIIPFEYLYINSLGKQLLAFRNKQSKIAEILDQSGKKLFEANIEHKSIQTNSMGYSAYREKDNKRVLLNDRFEEIYGKGFNNYGAFGKEAIWIEKFGSPNIYEIFDYNGIAYPIIVEGKPRNDFKKIKRVYRTPFFNIQLSDDKRYLYNSNTKTAYLINSDLEFLGDALYKSHGLVAANKEYREDMGIIDTLGNEVLPPVFKNIKKIGNILSVRTKDRNYILSDKGAHLFDQYDTAFHLFENFYGIEKDGKLGVANLRQEIIIPIKYKRVVKNGILNFEVTTDSGQKIILDSDGQEIRK